MKRNISNRLNIYAYPIQEEPIILSKYLLDILLKEPNPADLIGLYCFYYYTSKWQGTNFPKATTTYSAKGMNWGVDKTRSVKKRLKELGLIEDVTRRGLGGEVTGHFVKINFVWSLNHIGEFPSPMKNPGLGKTAVNTLITNNKNTFFEDEDFSNKEKDDSSNSINSSVPIVPSQFSMFWNLYPKHKDQGKAMTAWDKICNRPTSKRPTWRQIKKAIVAQKKTERWEDPQYIPFPATWLNQSRWLDDPDEMTTFKSYKDKPNKIMEGGEWWYLDKKDGKYYNNEGILLS